MLTSLRRLIGAVLAVLVLSCGPPRSLQQQLYDRVYANEKRCEGEWKGGQAAFMACVAEEGGTTMAELLADVAGSQERKDAALVAMLRSAHWGCDGRRVRQLLDAGANPNAQFAIQYAADDFYGRERTYQTSALVLAVLNCAPVNVRHAVSALGDQAPTVAARSQRSTTMRQAIERGERSARLLAASSQRDPDPTAASNVPEQAMALLRERSAVVALLDHGADPRHSHVISSASETRDWSALPGPLTWLVRDWLPKRGDDKEVRLTFALALEIQRTLVALHGKPGPKAILAARDAKDMRTPEQREEYISDNNGDHPRATIARLLEGCMAQGRADAKPLCSARLPEFVEQLRGAGSGAFGDLHAAVHYGDPQLVLSLLSVPEIKAAQLNEPCGGSCLAPVRFMRPRDVASETGDHTMQSILDQAGARRSDRYERRELERAAAGYARADAARRRAAAARKLAEENAYGRARTEAWERKVQRRADNQREMARQREAANKTFSAGLGRAFPQAAARRALPPVKAGSTPTSSPSPATSGTAAKPKAGSKPPAQAKPGAAPASASAPVAIARRPRPSPRRSQRPAPPDTAGDKSKLPHWYAAVCPRLSQTRQYPANPEWVQTKAKEWSVHYQRKRLHPTYKGSVDATSSDIKRAAEAIMEFVLEDYPYATPAHIIFARQLPATYVGTLTHPPISAANTDEWITRWERLATAWSTFESRLYTAKREVRERCRAAERAAGMNPPPTH